MRRKFSYQDFTHFTEAWTWKNGFLREYEDFPFMAEAVARDPPARKGHESVPDAHPLLRGAETTNRQLGKLVVLGRATRER